MKIGITERGDAALDMSWRYRLGSVDGCILITKELTEEFCAAVMEETLAGSKLIVHCTCTGRGQTDIEPNVPTYKNQLGMLKKLLDSGFPKERAVLRIDPVIPTKEGLDKAGMVLKEAQVLELLPSIRIRISILDEYWYVKERLHRKGLEAFYGSGLYAPKQMMVEAKYWLQRYAAKYGVFFESCAEPFLDDGWFKASGCVSQKDLEILGLEYSRQEINPQNRRGCLCLQCKTELLTRRSPCGHKCIYCYWKDTV